MVRISDRQNGVWRNPPRFRGHGRTVSTISRMRKFGGRPPEIPSAFQNGVDVPRLVGDVRLEISRTRKHEKPVRNTVPRCGNPPRFAGPAPVVPADVRPAAGTQQFGHVGFGVVVAGELGSSVNKLFATAGVERSRNRKQLVALVGRYCRNVPDVSVDDFVSLRRRDQKIPARGARFYGDIAVLGYGELGVPFVGFADENQMVAAARRALA